jgi:coproporphyrinogen III oxidase-like Fe-S oxidoreductase
MGVQSFNQDLLESCGRSHGVEDVRESISIIQKARVSGKLRSWSLDLISALPGLTPARWSETLREAIRAGPDHISVYDLQIEEGTPFSKWHEQGKITTPQDEDAAEMYSEAVSTLTQGGYEHYEVSNYSKPGTSTQMHADSLQGLTGIETQCNVRSSISS